MGRKWTESGPKVDQKWTERGRKVDPKRTESEPKMDRKWQGKWLWRLYKRNEVLMAHRSVIVIEYALLNDIDKVADYIWADCNFIGLEANCNLYLSIVSSVLKNLFSLKSFSIENFLSSTKSSFPVSFRFGSIYFRSVPVVLFTVHTIPVLVQSRGFCFPQYLSGSMPSVSLPSKI